jgi:hypothetical protein
MADSQSITLYTSIPPKLYRMAGGIEYGDAYQKECINSWISAGFRVVSINPKKEIANIESKYPQVRFVDSGSEDVRTKIQVFLRNIAASGESVSGIINADCYILDCHGIANRIRAWSQQESIVPLRRLDIDRVTLRPTGRKCLGFDGFLFDTRFISRIEELGDWTIGMPWWDCWFPVAMKLAGARILMLEAPVLLHLEHEQRWGFDEHDTRVALLWDLLVAHSEKTPSGEKFLQTRVFCGADPSNKPRQVGQIANRIISWLYLQSETIRFSNEGVPGDFLGRVLMGLEESQEASLRHQLETVTLARWLRSKRAAVRRLGDRIRTRLPSLKMQSPRAESRSMGNER